jgi:hypothetical protein
MLIQRLFKDKNRDFGQTPPCLLPSLTHLARVRWTNSLRKSPRYTRISHKIIFRSHNPYLVKVRQNKGFNSVLFFLFHCDRGQTFIL